MKHSRRYIEEIPLGIVHNPHTNRSERLTEQVIVCPSGNSLRSLRRDGVTIRCIECARDIIVGTGERVSRACCLYTLPPLPFATP